MKAKLADAAKKGDKSNKENQGVQGNFVATSKIIPSNEIKFSKMSGEADMNLMISKS